MPVLLQLEMECDNNGPVGVGLALPLSVSSGGSATTGKEATETRPPYDNMALHKDSAYNAQRGAAPAALELSRFRGACSSSRRNAAIATGPVAWPDRALHSETGRMYVTGLPC